MFSLQLGIHDVEGFVPPLEALFDERAKHPVLLVETVEESADIMNSHHCCPVKSGAPVFNVMILTAVLAI